MAERSKRKQRNALKHRAYSTIGQLPGSSIGLRVARINDLVQEHVEGQDNVDLVALAANIAESLVDLILLAPEEEQAKLLAATIAQLGQAGGQGVTGSNDSVWSMPS